jgi:hypothetical protein
MSTTISPSPTKPNFGYSDEELVFEKKADKKHRADDSARGSHLVNKDMLYPSEVAFLQKKKTDRELKLQEIATLRAQVEVETDTRKHNELIRRADALEKIISDESLDFFGEHIVVPKSEIRERVKGVKSVIASKYLKVIIGQDGVLFLRSAPGRSKSAIAKFIAKEMGWNYIDMRLSQIDETELGYPTKQIIGIDPDTGLTMEASNTVPPRWAYFANLRPTLINFDELNRALPSVRNAALQMLNERTIGTEFKFNDNVYMIATGNIGEEDNTDVEELDSAHMGRLIPITHTLTLPGWIEDFAKDNVHWSIVQFLSNHETYFSSKTKKGVTDKLACNVVDPRRWTYLSVALFANFGDNPAIPEIIGFLEELGPSYITAEANTKFISFLESRTKVSLKILMDNYEPVRSEVYGNFGKISELLLELKEYDITKLFDKDEKGVVDKVKNLVAFLYDVEDISQEQLYATMLDFLDRYKGNDNDKKRYLMAVVMKAFGEKYLYQVQKDEKGNPILDDKGKPKPYIKYDQPKF